MTLTIPGSLSLALVTLAAATSPHAAAKMANAALPLTALEAMPCGATAAGSEHHYAVTGRLKLLVIWTGRREVGQARFVRTETAGVRRLALLVGTDPDRAPRRINRWGYIAETTCGAETLVTGVMTESKEQSVEQASARANDRSQQPLPLRTIHSRVSATESATETATILPARAVTYQDLDDVLAMAPSTTTALRIAVPPRAESGFLRAVTALMHDSAALYRDSRKPAEGLHRLYVYGGTLYDMTLRHSRPTRTNAEEIESDFSVRNRATGATTEFQIAYSTSGRHPSVARRIVFRPRRWLELELLLKERS